MNRTSQYYKAYMGHRAALRDAWAAYNKGVKALEGYKGSAGHADAMKRLADERDKAIKAAREKYANEFDLILSGMRLSIDYMPMPGVTDEQLNIVQMLKLRENPTRDELRAAAVAVKENPLALGVVHEIAEKHGIRGMRGEFAGESATSARRCIEHLTASARDIIALDKVDARKERGINAMRVMRETNLAGNVVKALKGYRVDVDFDNVGEALSYFGGVDNLREFENFVNRDVFTQSVD